VVGERVEETGGPVVGALILIYADYLYLPIISFIRSRSLSFSIGIRMKLLGGRNESISSEKFSSANLYSLLPFCDFTL
jgi:hypothetical protein